jgi:DNA gyrase/topoisomerase IV subunit B
MDLLLSAKGRNRYRDSRCAGCLASGALKRVEAKEFVFVEGDAASGCARCSQVSERQWHHSLEGPINLVARRSVRAHQRPRYNQTLLEPAAL